MRVIAGERRRYKLLSPRGDKIRPTPDIIKETLFNMIESEIYDCVFLDLFAGTGQIGIEALSRGAQSCVFIDRDRDSIKLIRENLSHVGYDEYAVIIQGNLPNSISKADYYKPNLIFMDPPYDKGLYLGAFKALSELSSLNEDALIIAEANASEDFSFLYDLGFFIEKEKIYKTNKHVFVRKKDA